MTAIKVLLDNNIWSYLADSDAADELSKVTIASGIQILVAPGVVDESLARPNQNARRKVLSLITDNRWKRLLPEAYLECEEFKEEVRRLRPEWIVPVPKLAEINRLKYDWTRKKGGYWERARKDIVLPATNESARTDEEHRLAREESIEIRKRINDSGTNEAGRHLQSIFYIPEPGTAGWNGQPVEYWRAAALNFFLREFSVYSSAYREWIDSEVSIGAMMLDGASFNRFWLHDVSSTSLQRQWLRAAFEFLQQWHKISPGTPGDSRIASHLVDSHHIISADKNFVRFAERCWNEAPFTTAKPHKISADRLGVTELITLLSELGSSNHGM